MANPPEDASLPGISRGPWTRPAALLALFLLLSCSGAYFSLFFRFRFYDDEGYLLLSLRQFLQGHPLYDEVFSQYGPVYYLIHGLFYKATAVAISHDSMRLLVLAQAVGIALLAAGTFFRLTGNRWLFVLAVPLMLMATVPLFDEPGHPQTLAMLLLSGLTLTAARKDATTNLRSAALMGAGVGMLLMTKINVGIFALLALVWTLVVFSRPGWRRVAAPAVGLAILVFPWLLMAPQLGVHGYGNYALTISLSFLTVALFCLGGESAEPVMGRNPWLVAAGSCLAAVVLIAAATLLSGTSGAGLLRGVAWRPGRTMFVYPWPFDIESVACSAVSLGCALLLRFRPTKPGTLGFGLLLALKTGFALMTAIFPWTETFPHILPFVWVGLLPGAAADQGSRPAFGRVLLVTLATLQVLVAYPIAGTQKAVAMVPFVLLGVLCLHDAWRMGTFLRPSAESGRGPAVAGGLLAAAVLVVQGCSTAEAFRQYRSGSPLDLPGARLLRLPPYDAERLRTIVRELEPYDSFVTVPGMNSLYLFSRKEPPTTLNCTAWMILLSDAEQERVIAAFAPSPRACVVYDRFLQRFWAAGRSFDDSPLLRFVTKEFRHVKVVGGYELHERSRN